MRHPSSTALKFLVACAALCLVVFLGACASGGGGGGASEPAAEGSEAAAPAQAGVAPPSDHRMAKITRGMPAHEVSQIMGDPSNVRSYMTGKGFIPFYYGSDTHRTEWKYAGEGRVIFNHNRWTQSMKVTRVDYDPNEDGN